MRSEFNYIARGNTTGKPEQLVILLHGYGRDAHVMESQADEVLKLLPDALVIMPHAPEICDIPRTDEGNMLKVPQVIVKEGRDADNTHRRQWFSIHGGRAEIKDGLFRTAETLNQFIDQQRDKHGLKDADIALMGFSQGGSVALYTAFSRAAKLGCVVSHSSLFLETDPLSSKPDTFFLYGLADEEFPPRVYMECAANVYDFTDHLTVRTVPGLGHKTSDESRRHVASYIAHKMKR